VKLEIYEVVDGHRDRMALVTDLKLAERLALALWGGKVHPLRVDDEAARRLLGALSES
jgi:hypothetical protein